MRSRSFLLFTPVLFATLWGAAWGCSASGKSNVFETTDPTGSGDPTGTGGAGGSGGIDISGGNGGGFLGDAGVDGSFNQDAACAATSSEAKIVPLDMIILLDRSGSMDDGVKWPGATSALKQYVTSPDAAGVNVGIVYFPIDAPPDNLTCNYKHYDDLVVPVAELPANAANLVNSIDSQDALGGGTPMYGAMKGALFAATAYQDANPLHKVIVVFASDGDPNSCSFEPGNPPDADDIPTIAALAKSALNYNGVQTYVIAIQGSSIGSLNQIAAAGGTMQALDVTANINLFLDKMKEIQTKALACDFPIPEAPMGETFDKELVAVKYTPATNPAAAEEIPRADNYGDCGAKVGWYYDNNVTPTKIVLCPASCQKIKDDLQSKIDVLFGCAPDIN
ncbi:MAG TPA: vWA domain-containing protein [Polyangiaceae bacterium]|jgi:Mg-chelatase subunit ChlD|nr:vWA domain-containing protein [Polyangiaceae bacterium]